ncbi:ABC transporter permease subunit [Pseudonocardia kujensis]|uniref:ABC transporter permease n=1 Tax=Pseudonocardia kujensis TaxID=1128675 RepID=UPI001E5C870C|nr:ABC transporter permease subunit [Pseudonocardia kujensis]MCE0765040.1 ABC transporter permease subunit [Pseudonocardia kujensis]
MTELLTRPDVGTPPPSHRVRRDRRIPDPVGRVGPAAGVIVTVGLWWLLSATLTAGTDSVPSPPEVLTQLIRDLSDSVYWNAVAMTGLSALTGYGIGSAVALSLAVLVLLLPQTDALVTQIAVVCSCVPLTAVAPLVTLMSVAGSRSTSVFLAALSVTFPTVIGTLLGLRAAHATQLDVIRAYGGSRFTELVKVRARAALPALLAALRIGAPAAFLGAVLGEYFLVGVDSGLGILLLAAQATSSSVKLWAVALICGAVPGAAYWLVGLLARAVAPWSGGAGGKGRP